MATSRLRKNTVFATNWSTGGVQRSSDYGDTWPVAPTLQAWGVDIAKDDPNVVVFGEYSTPFNAMFSLDGGTTFSSIAPPSGFNNNYSFYLRDRASIFAEQSGGIWKMQHNYTFSPTNPVQTMYISNPMGGEVFAAGSVVDIAWLSNAVTIARIEYRRTPLDPWQVVADVGGYLHTYAWTLPWDMTTGAKIRISDLWDATPYDSLDNPFTITAPVCAETPASLDFGIHAAATSTLLPLTLHNTGTGTLNVTSITLGTSVYAPGRTALSLAPAASDTVGIWFTPLTNGTFEDTVTIVSDDALHTPLRVPVTGASPAVTLFAARPDTVHMPDIHVGYSGVVAVLISDPGSGPLNISDIVVSNPRFWVGRTGFGIAPGENDTVGVFYAPTATVSDTAVLTITSDDLGSPHTIVAEGRGITSLAADVEAPTAFALWQNRPNPFNRATVIQYTLPRDAEVTLDVFNLRGERVARMVGGHETAGRHEVRFGLGARTLEGTLGHAPPGVYFYRLQAGPLTATRKMLLVP